MSGHFHYHSRLAPGALRLPGCVLLVWLLAAGCTATTAEAPKRLPPPPRARVPALSMAVPSTPVKVSNDVFPSGMRLVVREDSGAGKVALSVSYRVGATDEPAGKEGVAELAARLTLVARHGGASTNTLEERLEAVDATASTTTTYDDTELGFTLAPARFAQAVGWQARRMAEPLAHVTEQDFLQVRARLMDDLWVRHEAMDKGPARRWLHEKLLAGHAYGRPVGGTPEMLERITLEDVRAFVRTSYTPAHAVLVVSGPIPISDVKFEVMKAFSGFMGVGSETRVPPVVRVLPPALEDPAGEIPMVTLRGAVKSPQLHFLLTVPGRYSGKYIEGKVAEEALKQWMDANFRRKEYPLGNSYSVTFQELDALTVLSGSLVLRDGVGEAEARKMAPAMLATLDGVAAQLTEGLRDTGLGPSWSFQAEQGVPLHYRRGSDASLRWRLNQELHREAYMVSAGSLARVLRATGRADIRSLREEQLAQALSYESLAPYLRQYLRAERVRTMLILPP